MISNLRLHQTSESHYFLDIYHENFNFILKQDPDKLYILPLYSLWNMRWLLTCYSPDTASQATGIRGATITLDFGNTIWQTD